MSGKVTAILLAGGQSKRMGSDKAFLKLGKKTFLSIIAEKLSKYCDHIIISGNKEKEIYLNQLKEINADIYFVKDQKPYDGPLNGIVSCKKYVKGRYVFIATCDTPLLKEEIIPYFLKEIDNFEAIIPFINGKNQFLNTLYKAEALEKAEEAYKKGNKSLFSWIKTLRIKKISEKEIKAFDKDLYSYWSINTPEDYKRIKNIWEKLQGGYYQV